MLRRVDLQDLELSRAYFHFNQISNLGRIEKDNLTSKQADCSALLKETRRIYFSTGVSGILKFHDVYLKWRMNEIFGKKAIENKYDDNLKKTKIYEWNRTFITKEYKKLFVGFSSWFSKISSQNPLSFAACCKSSLS